MPCVGDLKRQVEGLYATLSLSVGGRLTGIARTM